MIKRNRTLSVDRDPELEAIDRAAGEWFWRAEGKLSDDDRVALQEWLATDPRHAEQFRQYNEAWGLLDDLRGAQAADKMPQRKRRGSWRVASLAAAALLAVGLFLRPYVAREPSFVSYEARTDASVIRKLELPDGSVIRLNSATAVVVEFDSTKRSVNLQRGEAHFTVAKDPARPFLVSVAGMSVRAVGTAFNVSLQGAAVEVFVNEGRVQIVNAIPAPTLPAVTASEPPILKAGEKAVVSLPSSAAADPSHVVSTVSSTEAAQILSWQERTLEFDQTPLSGIVAEFNRYNQHQLSIADPELGRRTFGGKFRADNYELLVELLETRFGVSSERTGNTTVLRLRR